MTMADSRKVVDQVDMFKGIYLCLLTAQRELLGGWVGVWASLHYKRVQMTHFPDKYKHFCNLFGALSR